LTVLLVERGPPGLLGELTKWFLEPKAGVFVGSPSKRVRDEIWLLVTKRVRAGAALMLEPAATEQGFRVRSHGKTRRQIVDSDGLILFTGPVSK